MIVYQNFEWDLREAAANLATYGVSFKEAATVFAAENVAVTEDVDSDQLYARGPSSRGRTLIVLHTRGARIRILGAMVQQAGAVVAPELEAAVGPEPLDDVGAKPAEASAQVGTPAAAAIAARVHEEDAPRRRRRRRRRGGSRDAVAGAPDPMPEVKAPEAPREDATGPAAAEARAAAAGEARAAEAEAAATDTRAADAVAPKAAVVETVVDVAGAKKAPAPDAALPALRRGGPRRVPRENAATPLALAPSAPLAAAAIPSSRSLGSGLTADEYEVYWGVYSAAREEAKRQGKSLKEAQRIGREAGERAVAPRAQATAPTAIAPTPAPKRALSWRAAARAVK